MTKIWQKNKKNKVYRISDVQELCIRCRRISSFFSSKLIESCTKLEHTSVVRDYVEFKNLKVFGPKVVQLEMKTNENFENNFWMIIRPYPWYINDSNSHFWICSKHSLKKWNSSGPSPKFLFLGHNKLRCILEINLKYLLSTLVQGHILSRDSILLWLHIIKRFVWLLNHYIIFLMLFDSEKVIFNPPPFFFFFFFLMWEMLNSP